jgi:hypothetical protein
MDDINAQLYDNALQQAIAELSDVMSERESLVERIEDTDQRIMRLRRGAMGLGALCGRTPGTLSSQYPDLFPDNIDPDTGLSDAVRDILRIDPRTYYSPVDVRNRLRDKGYEIGKHKNVLASIHTVLKRLKNQDELKEANREGRTVYQWIEREIAEDDIPF